MAQVGFESENGWRPAKVGVDSLVWVTVPGTNVNLQLQKGWPAKVMAALAADFNAFVEPLRDRDSASFTATNSVPTSNHLNATAMDLNWDSHPFHAKGTFNASQMKTIRELLEFYEGTIFWAGDWQSPIDEMHWQMGYGTWNNSKVGSFISRKIRSDGFSTFRRGPIEAKPKDEKPSTPTDLGKGFLMALSEAEQIEIRDKIRQLWGASFNLVPSKSRYADPNDLWASKDFDRNMDGFMFDMIMEHDAALGDTAALNRIQKAAAAGDLIAQHFLEKLNNTTTTVSYSPPKESAAAIKTSNNVTCWNCGKHYPDLLPNCPFCGSPQQRPVEIPSPAAVLESQPVTDPPARYLNPAESLSASPKHALPEGDLPSVNRNVVDQLSLLQRFNDQLPQEVSTAVDFLIPILKGLSK